MKKVRIVLSAFLLLIMVFSWFIFVTNKKAAEDQYLADLSAAEEYLSKNLYQKAIERYQSALAAKESLEVRNKLLDAYCQAYQDGTVEESEYAGALEAACKMYPRQEELWCTLLQFNIDSSSYDQAFSVLRKAENAKVQGENYSALKEEILYSFTLSFRSYDAFFQSPFGDCTMYNGDVWTVLLSDSAEEAEGIEFAYIGPFNENGETVYRSSVDTRLKSSEDIVEAYISQEFTESRAYGEGLLPIKTESGWAYLNCETKELVSPYYEDASSFTDGVAAVKNGDTWRLIDPSFAPVSDKKFSDVKMYGNGAVSYKGKMVAAEGGKYGIYSSSGEIEAAVGAVDMDISLGENIAFMDGSGKWGYVNAKGDVEIEPQFAKAKSFSNGLAAVSDGNAWGFIEESGNVVIDYQFASAAYFTKSGACFVGQIEDQYNILVRRFPKGL